MLLVHLSFSQVSERSLGTGHWRFQKKGDEVWLKAKVPGTVHTDLLANEKIPDPYFGKNEKDLQWIENEDWIYATTFSVSKSELTQQHIELSFEGLDTYAKVFVNDSLVITADNMFRSWNADIKKYLRKGTNRMTVVFESAVCRGKEEANKLSYTLPGEEKVFTRKAQYQYGWDWGPRFVTCGIWKEVKLKSWNDARISSVKYIQHSLSDSVAQLEFRCEVESDVNANAYLDIIKGNKKDISGQIITKVKLKKGLNAFSIFYTIRDPQRWWCSGLGFPTLYKFSIALSYDSRMLDEKALNVGLRTIELVRDNDSVGSSFYFKLNGVPVFMKGANFIPPDNFLPRVSKQDYDKIIKNAVDANMNMLRVWGGGTYADDEFYEQCDKEGILVWQDMMFACAMYPGDDHFVKNVAEECIGQVERLRNHPCIALWCGNNEVDEGWKNWEWQKQYHYSERDSTEIARNNMALFNGLLSDLVNEYDGSRPYWPSSPSIGWGHEESLLQGDSHYWGVWWGNEPFEMYEKKVGRFVSEYGFQGIPSLKTLEECGAVVHAEREPGGEGNSRYGYHPFVPDTAILGAHQKHPSGYQIIRTYMARDYKVPVRFEDYAYVSQLLQAEGLKTAIEAHRRAKPYCMGSLYWQLNDCWPVTSWSSVDCNNEWKAAHYQAKRSFDDVIISVVEEKDSIDVYVVSDLLKDEKALMTMELFDLSGGILFSKQVSGIIHSNASFVFCRFDASVVKEYNRNEIVLRCRLKSNENSSSDASCYYYFSKPLNLSLKKPVFNFYFDNSEKLQSFSIESDVLAKNVFLSVDGKNLILSDNYFDLLPGEQKRIYLPEGVRIKRLTEKKIKIKTLADTY
ncbi:MAG: glycosyl hydrolase 2 galactose-binding domain-containing protein [Bacteroidia bacterium]